MYAEFTQISLLNMANSELVQDEKEAGVVEFDVLKRCCPELEFHDKCQASSSSSLHDRNIPDGEEQREAPPEDNGNKNFEESNVKESEDNNNNEKKKKKICLGEFKEEDGFRTPTSLEHKIPVMKECPPAPRKPKPLPSNKRKALPTRTKTLQLDSWQDLDSLFFSTDLHRKVKKTRTQDHP